MVKMKIKLLGILAVFCCITVTLFGCRTENNQKIIPDSTSNNDESVIDKNVKNKEEDTEINKDIIITETSVGNFTVNINLKEGIYIADELSPYLDTYQGDFEFVVTNDREAVFKEKITIGNANEILAFKKDIILQTADYNGDGNLDFALGQYASSNSFIYQFYTINNKGKISLLSLDSSDGKTIEAKNEGYSPIFESEDSNVSYEIYNQELGEYRTKLVKIK